MAETLRHRGPDDQGLFTDERVSLAHRRLAILDLSPRGRQPMAREGLQIVYNGEVYNFRDLRAQLQGCGHVFHTGTDTEVLLAAYHQWGPECVTRFNGMWALCIYDPGRGVLFLSRDPFGIKPLYYYYDGTRFIFASELKAIRVHNLDLSISVSAVNAFFYQKYIGGDRTIFEQCHKLPPGHNLTFDLAARKPTVHRYYDLEARIGEQQERPLEDRLGAVESLLAEAVDMRLIADVPVGSFLSGGVDSSLISALISRRHADFQTFSIGFREASYNELGYSRQVAGHLGTRHHYDILEIDPATIERLLEAMDEPFGDASLFPTYLVSQIARRQVTVCLSGDGADEVFGGYDTYLGWHIARHMPRWVAALAKPVIERLPVTDKKVTLRFKARRFLRDLEAQPVCRHLNWMATFPGSTRTDLLGTQFVDDAALLSCPPGGDLLAVQLADIHHYLAEDILKKVDLASMLHGLEARVPMLDHRLVPLALSLPEPYKIRGLTTKWLLRRIAAGYVPRRIVRRPKRGFTSPISRWIRELDLVQDRLQDRRCYEHGLVSYDLVQKMLESHRARARDFARELWLVFVFNDWMVRHG